MLVRFRFYRHHPIQGNRFPAKANNCFRIGFGNVA